MTESELKALEIRGYAKLLSDKLEALSSDETREFAGIKWMDDLIVKLIILQRTEK